MLLIVFRTVVAMLIPIALAIVALATAFLLLFIFAGLTTVNTVTPILVSMIGLGVGIDYSLFIVTRFRELLHAGLSPRDAAAEAGATAGRAVIFAGVTVAISVTGLAFIGLYVRDHPGGRQRPGRADDRASSPLAAPLGARPCSATKVNRLKVPFLKPGGRHRGGGGEDVIARWGRFVTAPTPRIVFPVVLLPPCLVLASTSTLVRLGAADQGTEASGQTSRRAYDLLAEGFGPGFNGPIPIVVNLNGDPGGAEGGIAADLAGPEGRGQDRTSRSSTTTSRLPSSS